jgi:hypothetical protein
MEKELLEARGTEKINCDVCAEVFKTEIDLQAHLFNNAHCDKRECQKCLKAITISELNTFGGVCEECELSNYTKINGHD